MSSNLIVLYSYWRSSCSWRVRIALNLKNIAIDYEYLPVDLKKEAQFDNKYSDKLNSMKQVPTLLIDNEILTQSVAMMEYLDESRRYSGHQLLPKDPKSRALVRVITEILSSGVQL